MARILLIDDDIELAGMLSEYLTQEGFDLVAIHDGESGRQEAVKGQYDLVVLDVMLPGMKGIEVLHRIRLDSQIPVLMLTAKGDDVDRIVGLESGADDYVPKLSVSHCALMSNGVPDTARPRLRDSYCLRRPDRPRSPRFRPQKAGLKLWYANDSTTLRDALQVAYGRRYRVHPSATRPALGLPGGRRASMRSFLARHANWLPASALFCAVLNQRISLNILMLT